MDITKISILSKLKPAGTKIILEPNKSELLDLIKLTLFDLVLKQVLIIKKQYIRSDSRSPLRECIVVETGRNFKKYQPDSFEEYFISKVDEESYYHLRPYLRTVYKELPGNYGYKKDIINDLKISNFFKADFIFRVLRRVKLNKRGIELKNDIVNYLSKIDKKIGDLIENKPSEALELVLFLKGNIFLLENIKFEFFERLKAVSISKSNNQEDYVDDYFWFDLFDDNDSSFSDLFSEIDEVFDNIDSLFDSGFDGGDYDFVDFD